METDWRRVYIVKLDVLIVPCGMETLEAQKALEIANGINCTLRNGNRVVVIVYRLVRVY